MQLFMCILGSPLLSQEDSGRLKAEVAAKGAEMDRQQGQLQTLTVSSHSWRKDPCIVLVCELRLLHVLVVRRTKEGCKQR